MGPLVIPVASLAATSTSRCWEGRRAARPAGVSLSCPVSLVLAVQRPFRECSLTRSLGLMRPLSRRSLHAYSLAGGLLLDGRSLDGRSLDGRSLDGRSLDGRSLVVTGLCGVSAFGGCLPDHTRLELPVSTWWGVGFVLASRIVGAVSCPAYRLSALYRVGRSRRVAEGWCSALTLQVAVESDVGGGSTRQASERELCW